MSSSWASRLAAKQNHIVQRLTDNLLTLSGAFTDVILIRKNWDKFGDTITYDLMDMDVVNIAFGDAKDIPIRRFQGNSLESPDNVAVDAEEENKPFICYAPTKYKIDQGSLVVRYFDHIQGVNPNQPTTTNPYILILEVKEVRGTFGYRSMVHQRLDLTYYDQVLPEQIMGFINQMATRRGLLGW